MRDGPKGYYFAKPLPSEANGYKVSEVFMVGTNDDWVVDPVRERDMVTLQTCTLPDLQRRIIVRADRN